MLSTAAAPPSFGGKDDPTLHAEEFDYSELELGEAKMVGTSTATVNMDEIELGAVSRQVSRAASGLGLRASAGVVGGESKVEFVETESNGSNDPPSHVLEWNVAEVAVGRGRKRKVILRNHGQCDTLDVIHVIHVPPPAVMAHRPAFTDKPFRFGAFLVTAVGRSESGDLTLILGSSGAWVGRVVDGARHGRD
jgi:hypothetical protein